MAAMATSIARASACPPLLSSVRMLVEVRSGYACAPAAEALPRPISMEGTALAARFAFCVGAICAVIHGDLHRRLQSNAGSGACDVPVACACALQYRRPWRAAVHGGPPAPRCASRRAQFSGWDAGPGWCSCVEEARMRGYGTQTDVGVAEGLKYTDIWSIQPLTHVHISNSYGTYN